MTRTLHTTISYLRGVAPAVLPTARECLALARALLLTAALASAHASPSAPLPIRWDAEASRPAPVQLDVFRGETLTLQPRLLSYGAPVPLTNATLTLYWQTNAMGQAWWSAPASAIQVEPGRVNATWSPSSDIGATAYTFFIAASFPSAPSQPAVAYRAHGTLRMRHSPGFAPATLPPPSAQWVSPAALQAVSNSLANATSNALTAAKAYTDQQIGQIPPPILEEEDPLALHRAGGTMEPGASITIPGHTPGAHATHIENGLVQVSAMGAAAALSPGAVAVTEPSGAAATLYATQMDTPAGRYQYPDTPGGGTMATKENIAAHADRTDNPHQVTAAQVGALTQATADSRYLSSTPGWFWQGSAAVLTNGWAGTPEPPATTGPGDNNFILIPYSTSRSDATGRVVISSSHYIVGVGVDWHIAMPADIWLPKTPMVTKSARIDGNTWELAAWCSPNPADANAFYYAFASNIIVQTYDRQEMSPHLYTNDAAGIIVRVDDAPLKISKGVAGNPVTIPDRRRAINAGIMEKYVDARKTEIADKAWRRTPSGKDAPSMYSVIIDQPLVQQGQMSWLQSGDYYFMSYEGGDFQTASTGSVWRLGPGGSTALEITSTNRMLHIQGIQVGGGYATIDISTNWVHGIPVVEFCEAIENQLWLEAPEQVINDHGAYWRVVVPATAPKRFFRAVDRQGDNRIRAHYTLEVMDDLILFGRRYRSLVELKIALEELP